MPTSDGQELMRECVVIQFLDGAIGTKNSVFDITIPEGYAMVIHDCDFGVSLGTGIVVNKWKIILCDDPDETTDPGYSAEKVIQSDEFHVEVLTSGISGFNSFSSKDCHKTMVVVNPNFIVSQEIDANATVLIFCRIWFEFIKISPHKILELLRQQQY